MHGINCDIILGVMKRRALALFMFSGTCIAFAARASLLTPQSFPKTVADLPFIERVELIADGYGEYASEYDANGVCISGCAYPGIRIEQVQAESDRATEEANEALAAYYAEQNNMPSSPPVNHTVTPLPTAVTPSVGAPNPPVATAGGAGNVPVAPPAVPSGEYGCPTNQWSKYIKRGNAVVDMAPLDRDLVVVSDIGKRNVANGSSWHQGLDLRASDNTPVYLPANGVVTAVAGGPSSGAGYYINVYHPTEKIYTRYLHLSNRLVKKGDKIAGGCLIAKSGHSGIGKAKKPYAPHLHYEIKKSESSNKSDVIDPFSGINRLGRSYKFKSNGTLNPDRKGVCPIGCTGFL